MHFQPSNPITHLPAACSWRQAWARAAGAAVLVIATAPTARAQPAPLPAEPPGHWADCTALSDNSSRLACFDRWAARQASASVASTASASAPTPVNTPMRAPAPDPVLVGPGLTMTSSAAPAASADDDGYLTEHPCADPRSSPLSRFWELEPASDCGTFGIRGYRPISLSWIGSDSVNKAPSSPAANHSVTTPVAYSTSEARIQLSVRTKIARGLLTDGASPRRDSLWFGYTQQSYWQLFNGDISRPFRSTDHEPELTYIFPTDVPLEGGWRWRYAGLSLNHQSNGQSLPLSRSWNRIIAMAGIEKDERFALTARAWARVPEKSGKDDNPDISDFIGRAELAASWNVDKANTLGLTVRHALRSSARGSVRLEWQRTIGSPRANGEPSRLRFHTQLFRGYGDSLLDYNRKRTVLSMGLSLVDF